MARVIRREVQCLPREDDSALLRVDDQRLMAGRVPWRGHDANAGPWLRFSVDLLEGRTGEVGDVRQVGVVVLLSGMREFTLLHEDRCSREVAVPSRVVGVEVAI